ncbi:MAG TPA: hypothetical protein VLR48_04825 [Thiocapsa sp.]|nr:hypothetical protein [Thiocapsa sp.]HSO81926.1 hypothetical protein [Thiocapsa sp.]
MLIADLMMGGHPGGEPGRIQGLPVLEKFQPAFGIALDRLDIEFTQFIDADATVIDERTTAVVTPPVAVGILGPIPKQRPVEDPDGIDRLQLAIVRAALEL